MITRFQDFSIYWVMYEPNDVACKMATQFFWHYSELQKQQMTS